MTGGHRSGRKIEDRLVFVLRYKLFLYSRPKRRTVLGYIQGSNNYDMVPRNSINTYLWTENVRAVWSSNQQYSGPYISVQSVGTQVS